MAQQAARRRGLRPTRRVLLAAAVCLVLFVALLTVMSTVTRTARSDLGTVRDRSLPGAGYLTDVHLLLDRAHFEFSQALQGSPDERAAGIAQAQSLQRRADAKWAAYLHLGPFGAREKALQAAFDAAGNRANEAAATALAAPDEAAYVAAVEGEAQAEEERLAAIEKIRRRYYQRDVESGVRKSSDALATIDGLGLAVAVIAILAVLVGAVVAYRRYARLEREQAARVAERKQHDRLSDLEVQLRRGLEMEASEEATFEVLEAVLRVVRGDEPTELLLAGSPDVHFRRVVRVGPEEPGSSCPVPSPHECPATSRGDTRIFPSSTGIDVCPFLRHRDGNGCSAVCVPIGIAGTASGVIHAVGETGSLPPTSIIEELELVAREAGERIGFLRVLARTEVQAETDHLTGLWNRRTLEARIQDVLDADERLVVAYLDLDHFKDINDRHGHAIGDRALRTFARVLRDAVRPNDLPVRYGGEEFVVVLPSCALGEAVIVVERVRGRLEAAVAGAGLPPFTLSAGLTEHAEGEAFAETIARADAAMLQAKAEGRNRIVTTDDRRNGST